MPLLKWHFFRHDYALSIICYQTHNFIVTNAVKRKC